MTELMEKGSSFVRDLGDAARENPISAALIGMGILWMFGGSAASVARRARVDRMLDRAGEASEATGSMIRTLPQPEKSRAAPPPPLRKPLALAESRSREPTASAVTRWRKPVALAQSRPIHLADMPSRFRNMRDRSRTMREPSQSPAVR